MKIKALATGLGWLGSGIESIQSNLESMILKTQYEIMIGAYSIGVGGIGFLELLREPLERGVEIRLILNRFDNHPEEVKQILRSLLALYLNFSVYNFSQSDETDLHAKIIISDRETALIGSANLSWRGFVANHELAVIVTDEEINKVASAFERLILQGYAEKVEL